MVGTFMVRGLCMGLVAGALAGLVAFAVGEPRVDRAISFEQTAAERATAAGGVRGEEAAVVTRDVQRLGLVVATSLYGLALGGLFGLAYAALRGRARSRTELSLAISMAAVLFVAVVVVPSLKYPANPPGVGDPETIGARTALYLVTVAISLLAALAAWRVGRRGAARAGDRLGWLAAAATFTITVGAALVALPAVDEVPADFPRDLLREFRLASLAVQLVLWTSLAGLFGWRCQRVRARARAGG